MILDNFKKILIIDNDLVIRYTLKKIFSNYLTPNLKIYTSSDGLQGLGYVYVVRPDLIIIDTTLPKYSGRELTEYIKTNTTLTTTPVILLNEGKEVLENLPANFIQISKDSADFPNNLVGEVSKILGQDVSVTIRPGYRLTNFLSKKILRYSNISDIESQKILSRNFLVRSLYYIKYLFDQFLTSIYLTIFYLVVGKKDYEETVDQKQKDLERFRVKTFPAIAFGLAVIFFGIIQFLMLSGVFVALTYVATAPAYAASYTWDGGGSDGTCGGQAGDGNKWSCAANWSSDIVPTAADAVTFNSTSTKDATIDASFGGTITSLTIATGYSGTITVSRSFTMSSSFSQATGTFNGNNQTITDSGTFSLSGGVFTSTSGTLSVAGNFTISGSPTFNHNNGTITFSGGAATINCGVSIVFNLTSFTGQTGGKIVGCNLPLGNNPTIPNSITLFGVLSGTGTLTQSVNSLVIQTASATLSGFSGLNVPAMSVIGGATLNAGSYTTFTVAGSIDINATSTLTLPNGADLNGALTITGGTFNAPSGTMTIAANLTISGSPTFNANGGTITFDGTSNQTLSCNNVTFSSVAFLNNGGKYVNAGCNTPIGNNPTLSNISSLVLNGGIVSGSGTLTAGHLAWIAGTFSGFAGLVITNDFTISGGNADLSAMTFVANASTVVTLTSGTLTLPNNADFNGNLVISGGTFNAPSGTVTLGNALTISGTPIFNANGGTVTFDGITGNVTCNSVTFNFVIISVAKTFINCTLPIGNALTFPNNTTLTNSTVSGSGVLTAGRVIMNAGSVLSGFSSLIMNNDFTVSGATVDFTGIPFTTGPGSILTVSSGSLKLPVNADLNGPLTISGGTFIAPSGNMTLSANLTISGSPTFNANGGTMNFDGAGSTLSCNNVAFNLVSFTGITGTKTVNSNCNLPLGANPTIPGNITLNGTLSGSGTINETIGALTLNTGAVLSGFTGYTGPLGNSVGLIIAGAIFDASSYTTFAVPAFGMTLSSGTITLPAGASINGGLTISGGTFNAPSGNMSVAGALTISGSPTFNANGGTITFNGTTSNVLSCNNVTFSNVVFAHSAGSIKTVNSNCNLPLGNNPTLGVSPPLGITLNGTLSGTGTLNISTGTLQLNAGASLSGFSGLNTATMTVAGATLNLGSYTTYINSSSLSISSGSLTLPSGSDLNGPLTISGGIFNAPSGNMTIAAALTISGTPTFNHNNGTITFDGNLNATLSCNNVAFNKVVFAHAGGSTKTINSNCNLPLGNNPSMGTGSANLTSNGVLSGTGTLTTTNGGLILNTGAALSGFTGLNTITMTVSGATLDLSSYSTYSSNTLVLSSGSIILPNGADLNGPLVISGGTFTAPSGNITVAGDLVLSGTGSFTHNNGTVILDGGNQLINGGFSFKNLTKIPNANVTLTFVAGSTQTVSGTLTLKGATGSILLLRSSVSNTQYNVNPTLVDVQNLNVKDFNNTGASVIQAAGKNITNSGNNTRWNFDNPSITNVGPIYLTNGSNISNNKPSYTFNITDPQASDTVKYQIQIDNNSDFSTPEVDYTSALQTQGAATFTVGQSAGSGTYTTGSENQTLADATYYVRIKGIDGTGGDGGYSTVNGTSPAFTVDTTRPTGSVIFGYKSDSTSRDIYLILTATDNLSGVDKMMISENSNFANASFEEYKTSKTYTVSDGYGTKTIYIKFRDKAGNESISYIINPSYTQVVVTPSTTPVVTQVPVSYGVPIGGNGNLTDGLSVIALRVIGKTNNPLANVTINIPGLGIDATTDENGLIVLENIPLGSYDVLGIFNNKEFNQNLDINGSESLITIKLEDSPNILTVMFGIIIILLIIILLGIGILYLYRRGKKTSGITL